jgi:predicted chitinase
MPRRNEEGWRYLGPLAWKVTRRDNYGDRSTTTTVEVTWITRWTTDLSLTRPWADDDE